MAVRAGTLDDEADDAWRAVMAGDHLSARANTASRCGAQTRNRGRIMLWLPYVLETPQWVFRATPPHTGKVI